MDLFYSKFHEWCLNKWELKEEEQEKEQEDSFIQTTGILLWSEQEGQEQGTGGDRNERGLCSLPPLEEILRHIFRLRNLQPQ